MEKTPVIIDCDPGHDDAMAILWTLASPELELKAVTTVAGNTSLEKVTDNAVKVLTKAKVYDIPVAKGAPEPLVRNLIVENGGTIFHGESGLGGPELPENGFDLQPMHAVDLMTRILEESDRPVTIIAIGPLTNLALLFRLRPDLKEKIAVISMMGGGAARGNWTPAAEYNIYADVEAAYVVFHSGVKIIMSGLDVTQKAYITKAENEILRAKNREIAVFVAELIDFFGVGHYEIEKFPGCTLHDPTAVAVLTHPEWFHMVECNVEIEMDGQFTKGMTVVDDKNYQENILGENVKKNAKVVFDVDREKYVEDFIEAMGRL
ncbi:nucleoside hydrolase [Hespellia stercorisuis]|uniref:Pyrimidine-specific ribonucleoside hydrolase n=1 Tax=Hespellia stercorisuis DSM 15480 TaxID=1121950 RepID=A0A1M6KBE4_9FIRM|nr:nucleoside hydrolase [Hespellia stercorisuis]SHJ56306.1 pyrimidine-specific ribonucleoside hydrolase [Hespellia stercorisuis DSM 15480]